MSDLVREAVRAQFPAISQRSFQKLWSACKLLTSAGMTSEQVARVMDACQFGNKRLNVEKFLAAANAASGHPESLLKRRGRMPVSVDRLVLQARVIAQIRESGGAVTLPGLHTALGIHIKDENPRRVVIELMEQGLLKRTAHPRPRHIWSDLPPALSGVYAILNGKAVHYVGRSEDMEAASTTSGAFSCVFLEFCQLPEMPAIWGRWVHQFHPPANSGCACGHYR